MLFRSGDEDGLFNEEMSVRDVNWISFDEPQEPIRAEVRIRYRHEPAEATISPDGKGGARVVFDVAQRAISPGQATIFYKGDEVLGGGWIMRT